MLSLSPPPLAAASRWARSWPWAGSAPRKRWTGASSGTSSWRGSSPCPWPACSAPPSWPCWSTASCPWCERALSFGGTARLAWGLQMGRLELKAWTRLHRGCEEGWFCAAWLQVSVPNSSEFRFYLFWLQKSVSKEHVPPFIRSTVHMTTFDNNS